MVQSISMKSQSLSKDEDSSDKSAYFRKHSKSMIQSRQSLKPHNVQILTHDLPIDCQLESKDLEDYR
jgi:hypothetical protein